MALSKKVATGFLELGVDDSRMEDDMKKTKSKAKAGFADIGKIVGGIFAGSALTRMVGYGQRMAREAEVAKVSFEVLTGSVEKGNKVFDDLRAFSDVTPFSGAEVQDAGKQLLAALVPADELTDKLGFLGDAAAGAGRPLGEIVAIFAKIRGAGKLTGETFLQFAEKSINLGPVLEEMLGVSNQELKKMQAAGTITADTVEKAFRKMNGEAGLFAGAMIKLSATTQGRLSTLFSKLAQIAGVIGNSIKPLVDTFVELGIKGAEAFLNLAPAMQNIVGVLINMLPPIIAVAIAFKLMKIAGVGAGVAIRGAMIATGIGIAIPLVIWLTSKFIDLIGVVRERGGPAMDMFRQAGMKLMDAWTIITDAVLGLVNMILVEFGILTDAIDWDGMLDKAFMWAAMVAEMVAEFVLDTVEWFKVIWQNWSTVMELLTAAWEVTWRSLVDILFNMIPFMIAQFIAFAEAVVDIFSSIPKAIVTLFAGGSIGDALDIIFNEATAKFAERQRKAFDGLFTPSEKTIAASQKLDEVIGKLGTEKKKLELERTKIDDTAEEVEDVQKEIKKKDGPPKKKSDDKQKFGSIGLAEFASELQAMFISSETDADDTAKKTFGVLTDSKKVQEDIQKGINDLNEKQKDSINVKIAEN